MKENRIGFLHVQSPAAATDFGISPKSAGSGDFCPLTQSPGGETPVPPRGNRAIKGINNTRTLKNSPLHFPQEYDIKKNNATNGKIAHRVPSRERRPSAASRLRRRALGSPGSGPRERDGVTPRYRRQSAHNRANAGGTAEGRAFRPRVL